MYLTTSKRGKYKLLLHNNSTSTFEEVIDALTEVCGHNLYQAEQCAQLIHYKGSICVKTDKYPKLELIKDLMKQRGIRATIEK
jgi:ATP-dependent Clp protease adaptor protein ClpS